MAESDRFDQIESLINDRFDQLRRDISSTNATIHDGNTKFNNDISQMRRVVITNLVQENRRLSKRCRAVEKRLIKVERQTNTTEQNNRKNNIEIDGIPSSVADNQLKSVVARLLNHLSVSDIGEHDIEAVHRIYVKRQPQPTIVRMKRNLLDEVKAKEARKKVTGLNRLLGFPASTKIYINDNLSPNMRSLAYNARILKQSKLITDTWFSNAAVRIRIAPGDNPIKITHEEDLHLAFPEFDGFTFDVEFFRRIASEEELDDLEDYNDLEGWWGANTDDESGEDDDDDDDEGDEDEDEGEEENDEVNAREVPENDASTTTDTDGRVEESATDNAKEAHAEPDLRDQTAVNGAAVTEEVDLVSHGTVSSEAARVESSSPLPPIPDLEELTPTITTPLQSRLKKGKKKTLGVSLTKGKSDAPPNITRAVAKSMKL